MGKNKKAEHWKNEWTSVDEAMPPIGATVITVDTSEYPSPKRRGNINQYVDGDWYHITQEGGRPKWWKFLTPEEFTYYQELAIDIWLENVKMQSWKNDIQ